MMGSIRADYNEDLKKWKQEAE